MYLDLTCIRQFKLQTSKINQAPLNRSITDNNSRSFQIKTPDISPHINHCGTYLYLWCYSVSSYLIPFLTVSRNLYISFLGSFRLRSGGYGEGALCLSAYTAFFDKL